MSRGERDFDKPERIWELTLAAWFLLRYGDHLYAKADYEGAMSAYLKTVGSVQPSYVIRKVSSSIPSRLAETPQADKYHAPSSSTHNDSRT